ncbi:hypothetical protein B0G81_0605 [Paraburkholderia sp. BL6665CI2N2]|nr:hypothetical protein B0G81_0605 [Paraburkholderia sp. BL6665CI2N2]
MGASVAPETSRGDQTNWFSTIAAIRPAAPIRPSNCSSVSDLRGAVGICCVVTGYSSRLEKAKWYTGPRPAHVE